MVGKKRVKVIDVHCHCVIDVTDIVTGTKLPNAGGPNANCANQKRPRDYFKREILIDTMIFSDEGLRHLVAEMSVGQIVYGTDIPFNWPVGVDLVLRASFLSDADKEAILGGNAARLLRLGQSGTV